MDSAQPCPNDDRITALERKFQDFIEQWEAPEQLPAVINSEHTEQRFLAMTRQIENLRRQVEEVKDLPRLAPEDVNNLSTALNTRVQSMIEQAITKEVTQLKIRLSSMERASTPELAKEFDLLSNIMSETGKLLVSIDGRVRDMDGDLQEAKAELKRLHNEFNLDLSNSLRLVVDSLQRTA